jgi:hypothetical protein
MNRGKGLKSVVRTIGLKLLLKGNHRLCLSARRALGRCEECRHYENCESKKKGDRE